MVWRSILEWLYEKPLPPAFTRRPAGSTHSRECQFVRWARRGARGWSKLETETGNKYNIVYDSTI